MHLSHFLYVGCKSAVEKVWPTRVTPNGRGREKATMTPILVVVLNNIKVCSPSKTDHELSIHHHEGLGPEPYSYSAFGSHKTDVNTSQIACTLHVKQKAKVDKAITRHMREFLEAWYSSNNFIRRHIESRVPSEERPTTQLTESRNSSHTNP